MKTKKYIYLILVLFAAVGCEKIIDFKGKIKEPMLVLNSIVAPDSTIKVTVTESKFFLENANEFKRIDNAELTLTVNGENKGTLIKSDSAGTYESNYKLSPNDVVKIEAKATGYESVMGLTRLPPKPTILQVDTTSKTGITYRTNGMGFNGYIEVDTLGVYKTLQVRFTMKFKDNADVKNYYRLLVKRRSYLNPENPGGGLIPDSGYIENYLTYFDDIVFEQNEQSSGFANSFNNEDNPSGFRFNIFADDLINGKEYGLKFTDNILLDYRSFIETQPDFPGPEKTVYYIYLQEISSDYYMFIRSMLSALEKNNNPFIEPVQIHSNIVNGIGLLGSYTPSEAYIVEINHKETSP